MSFAPIKPSILSMPPYLAQERDPAFPSTIQRIAGDTGSPLKDGAFPGLWGSDSRQHYSKDQPWSDDMSMLKLEQKGGSPGQLVVDGSSYRVLYTEDGNSAPSKLLRDSYESRWRPGHGHEMVSWSKARQELTVWDALDGTVSWQVHVPSECADFGLNGEGTLSDDGRWLALGTLWPTPNKPIPDPSWIDPHDGSKAPLIPNPNAKVDYFQVIDLDQHRVGPRNAFEMPYETQDHGDIDWCSISPLGNFVVVKYSSNGTPEYQRVFGINKQTLTARPQPMSAIGLRMAATQYDQRGWIACMSHADMNVVAGREVIVGGIRFASDSNVCNDPTIKAQGRIISVELASGIYRSVSAGDKFLPAGMHEASDHHTSCRAYRDRGWATHHYRIGSGVFADELVQWKLDGSRQCRRFGVARSDESTYRGEVHPCPSPDGKRILYASNWMDLANVKAYVVGL